SSLLLLPFVIKMLEPDDDNEINTNVRSWDKFTLKNIGNIFKKNEKLIIFYLFLFFGMAVEFMFLFAFLPPSISDPAFSHQAALLSTGGSSIPMMDILVNNAQILIVAFVLSIFFGVGSIFLLTYNASLVGAMYGSPLRTILWGTAPAFAANMMLYLPHTILEILAYLFAAVAGGILAKEVSSSRNKSRLGSESSFPISKKNIVDAVVILLIAFVVVVIAAYVEVYAIAAAALV
ncbi:MAG: stage II sporulation protein M, partial [Candidatus Aenigmatarchaeota archaeon]